MCTAYKKTFRKGIFRNLTKSPAKYTPTHTRDQHIHIEAKKFRGKNIERK